MSPQLKIQKVKMAVAAFLAVLIFFPASLRAQETSRSPEKNSRAELENEKAEWEKARDQQIAMIQEKEAQLEELKEELFRKMNAGAVRRGDGSGIEDMGEAAVAVPQPGTLEKKIADLKEANRTLADEISSLRARNFELEAAAKAALDGSQSALSDLFKKEKNELDAQKAAFLKERQKFFQEMNRQKEKLWALQSVPKDDDPLLDAAGSSGPGPV